MLAVLPAHASAFGLTLTDLGLGFFLIRMGTLVGGLIAPALVQRLHPTRLAGTIELISFAVTLFLYFALVQQWKIVVLACLAYKGIPSGLVSNVRMQWLRAQTDQVLSNRVLVLMQAILQGTYGVAGLFLLLGTFDHSFLMLVLADSLTCLLGAAIFFLIPAPKAEPAGSAEARASAKKLGLLESLGQVFSAPFTTLMFTEVLLTLGIGGSNMLMVSAGKRYFSQYGGYSTSILISGLGYFLTGYFIQSRIPKEAPQKLWRYLLYAMAFLAFSLSGLELFRDWIFIELALFLLIALVQPAVLLLFSTIFFQLTTPANVSGLSAARMTITSVLFALGEIVYSHLSQTTGIYVRVGMILLALAPTCFPRLPGVRPHIARS